MARLSCDDVTSVSRLSSLEALTLLCAPRRDGADALAVAGPPPFAPLAALPRLRRALLGCAARGAAWAAAGRRLPEGRGGSGPVTAHLCPAAWEDLSSLQVRTHGHCLPCHISMIFTLLPHTS
jgi:hypothetical protein